MAQRQSSPSLYDLPASKIMPATLIVLFALIFTGCGSIISHADSPHFGIPFWGICYDSGAMEDKSLLSKFVIASDMPFSLVADIVFLPADLIAKTPEHQLGDRCKYESPSQKAARQVSEMNKSYNKAMDVTADRDIVVPGR